MNEVEELNEFNKLNGIIEDLAYRLIETICEKPDFKENIGEKSIETLPNILYLLVKYEKFEQATIVRDELLKRGYDINSESEYKKIETKNRNFFKNKL